MYILQPFHQIHRRLLHILLIAGMVVAFFATSQAQNDEVYMLNGEYYKGEILALGTKVLLIRSDDRVFSVERSQIRYVFRSKDRTDYTYTVNRQPVERKPEKFTPLDRLYLIEAGGGLYTFSNFAMSIHLIHWFRLKHHWSLGVLGALDFSRYAMLRFGLQGKRTFMFSENKGSYFVGGVAIGPWADYFVDFSSNNVIDGDFSPVFQTNIGGGLWYDTGMKIAFTGEGGLSFNRFSIEEVVWSPSPSGSRVNFNQRTNLGPYFRVGMVF